MTDNLLRGPKTPTWRTISHFQRAKVKGQGGSKVKGQRAKVEGKGQRGRAKVYSPADHTPGRSTRSFTSSRGDHMPLRSNHTILGATVAAVVWLTSIVAAGGQAAAERPLLSEDVFKNVQVLKGITVN